MISHGNLTWANLGQIKAIKHVDDIITGGGRDRGSSSHQEVLTKYLLSKLLGNNPNDSPAFSQRRDSDSSYKFPLVRISHNFIRQHQHCNMCSSTLAIWFCEQLKLMYVMHFLKLFWKGLQLKKYKIFQYFSFV